MSLYFKIDNDNIKIVIYISFFKIDISNNQQAVSIKKNDYETAENKDTKKKSIDNKTKKSFVKIYELVLDMLKSLYRPLINFIKRMRVKSLIVRYVVGGTDPADVSLKYGQACIVVHTAFALCENILKVKNKDVKLSYDYNSDVTTYYVESKISVRIFYILVFLLGIICRLIINTLNRKINNKRWKAQNE